MGNGRAAYPDEPPRADQTIAPCLDTQPPSDGDGVHSLPQPGRAKKNLGTLQGLKVPSSLLGRFEPPPAKDIEDPNKADMQVCLDEAGSGCVEPLP